MVLISPKHSVWAAKQKLHILCGIQCLKVTEHHPYVERKKLNAPISCLFVSKEFAKTLPHRNTQKEIYKQRSTLCPFRNACRISVWVKVKYLSTNHGKYIIYQKFQHANDVFIIFFGGAIRVFFNKIWVLFNMIYSKPRMYFQICRPDCVTFQPLGLFMHSLVRKMRWKSKI